MAPYCMDCGQKLPEGARFCSSCGHPVEIRELNGADLNDIAFFDVETPNAANDRICSIGIVRTDAAGRPLADSYLLINPEVAFNPVNVHIHGISANDVSDAPTFAQAWPRIETLLRDARVVAHNANFDLSVLDKTLAAYQIQTPAIKFADTMTLSGSYLSGLTNCKLPTVCKACGVELSDHHNAFADAQACKDIFFVIDNQYGLQRNPDLWADYVPRNERQAYRAVFARRQSESSKAYESLINLCREILEDGHVAYDEVVVLKWWIERNPYLSDRLVDELMALIISVLEDGEITTEEEQQLFDKLHGIVNPIDDNMYSDISGKKFCLTGDFDYGQKEDVEAVLLERGGVALKSVTKACDLVIVGAQGSPAWAFGSYGSKIKKAMEWQEKGIPVQIVAEHSVAVLNK